MPSTARPSRNLKAVLTLGLAAGLLAASGIATATDRIVLGELFSTDG